jgi:hypothetical protein
MALVSCGCGNARCQADPHRGKDHCLSAAESATGTPEGWRVIESDPPGAMCRPCAKAMPMAMDESGGFNTSGALDQ